MQNHAPNMFFVVWVRTCWYLFGITNYLQNPFLAREELHNSNGKHNFTIMSYSQWMARRCFAWMEWSNSNFTVILANHSM